MKNFYQYIYIYIIIISVFYGLSYESAHFWVSVAWEDGPTTLPLSS